ncbi:hypothetical protein [Nocardioides dilutus]
MRTAVLAGLSLVAAGLPFAAPAQAAVEMCQGEAATIVSTAGAQIVDGTEGDDVIVVRDDTDGRVYALNLFAKGGDDLICVSGELQSDVVGEGGALIYGGDGDDSLEVRGSNARDTLFLDATTEKVDIQLLGGFDDLRFHGAVGSGTADAGKGGGTLKLIAFDEIRLDLGDERLKLDGTYEYEVAGFSRVVATGRRVILRGDSRANGFTAVGCRTTLKGRGGDDFLKASTNKSFEDCTPQGAHLFGETGDDRMTGTGRDDALIGGPGRDKAVGRRGIDKCVAEVERSCERSRGM